MRLAHVPACTRAGGDEQSFLLTVTEAEFTLPGPDDNQPGSLGAKLDLINYLLNVLFCIEIAVTFFGHFFYRSGAYPTMRAHTRTHTQVPT